MANNSIYNTQFYNNGNILKEYILNAELVKIANIAQFIQLEFVSLNFERIIVNIDCCISSGNREIETLVQPFKSLDKDIYQLVYFITVINKKVIDVFYIEKNLSLIFENSIEIKFSFPPISDEYYSELKFSFRKKYDDKNYIGFEFS